MVKIWVGVSGIIGVEIKVSTNLKGLCEQTGVSYSTAKSKSWYGRFTIVSGDIVEMKMWYFEEVELVKIKGRGNFGK